MNNKSSLIQAARVGDIQTVKNLLSKQKSVSYWRNTNSEALIQAAEEGTIEVVKALIPVSDPKANDSQALISAVLEGHVEVVKALIPVSDPKANNSQALIFAVSDGHVDIVKLLIPFCDINADDACALRRALEGKHHEIVNLLIPGSDIYMAVQALLQDKFLDIADSLAPHLSPDETKKTIAWLNKNKFDLSQMPITCAKATQDDIQLAISSEKDRERVRRRM